VVGGRVTASRVLGEETTIAPEMPVEVLAYFCGSELGDEDRDTCDNLDVSSRR